MKQSSSIQANSFSTDESWLKAASFPDFVLLKLSPFSSSPSSHSYPLHQKPSSILAFNLILWFFAHFNGGRACIFRTPNESELQAELQRGAPSGHRDTSSSFSNSSFISWCISRGQAFQEMGCLANTCFCCCQCYYVHHHHVCQQLPQELDQLHCHVLG